MEFKIIKAAKPEVKVRNSKYGKLFKAMKKLKVGDLCVVVEGVTDEKTNFNIRKIARGMKQFGNELPFRGFELTTTACHNKQNVGNDIVVRRTK